MNKKYWFWGVLVFFIVGFRWWDINSNFVFLSDQGRHLLEAKQMLDSGKVSLLGPMVTSKSVEGRNFFVGGNYYYILILIGWLTTWDPIKITLIFGLIDLGFWLFFCWWLGKKFGDKTGLIIFLFVALSPYLILHSRFFWNPHLLIPLSIACLYFVENKKMFLVGICWGAAVACHFGAALWVVPIAIILGKKYVLNIKLWSVLALGAILGDLPFIIFELRNNFYNIRTMIFMFNKSVDGGVMPHYFVYPFLVMGIYLIVKHVRLKTVYWVLLILLLWVLQLFMLDKTKVLGWKYEDQIKTVDIISQNCVGEFNIASLVDGDTRAYSLRYLLNYKKCNPMGVNDYSKAKTLYVVAPNSREIEKESVWEVATFGGKIVDKMTINNQTSLYKLEKLSNEKYVTIVNPVRSRELWKDKSIKPIADQYSTINILKLKATWLLQDDVFEDKELINKIKGFDSNQELGIFLEVSKNLALRARVYFDEQRPWYDPGVVFLSGYDLSDRKKIIDTIITDFKKTFGYVPKSVGAWWIDSYSQQYLENKYNIKTVLICADQKTTDKYGIWGQWWGYPYIPSSDNILVPGNSRSVVIQWAQRDLEKAYFGLGWQVSNYSLQANDYVSKKLDIKYFEKLASQYLAVEKLGQITVGLETGIESVGNEKEYKKQLKWISDNRIVSLKMSEFGDKYREIYNDRNPKKVALGDWVLTPDYRENVKLGEKTEYKQHMVFADFYTKDTSEFLNRIYVPRNLVKKNYTDYNLLIKILLIISGAVLAIKFKIKWWMILIIGVMIWILLHARYSVVNGERMIGILVDNFRFVGINLSKGLINLDLSNIVAKSMLKIHL